MSVCTVEGCTRPERGRGPLCKMHQLRKWRTGSTESTRDRRPTVEGPTAYLPLTRGFTAIIDAADLPLVSDYLWCVCDFDGRCYAGSSQGLLHRFLLKPPDEMVVDHRNGDGLDNRRANLRVGVVRDNSRNLTLRTTSQSGFIGVGWRANRNRWRAYVGIEGRLHHVGHFHTAEAAARARDDYVREHAPSEFWSYNFPRSGEQGIRRNERESA